MAEKRGVVLYAKGSNTRDFTVHWLQTPSRWSQASSPWCRSTTTQASWDQNRQTVYEQCVYFPSFRDFRVLTVKDKMASKFLLSVPCKKSVIHRPVHLGSLNVRNRDIVVWFTNKLWDSCRSLDVVLFFSGIMEVSGDCQIPKSSLSISIHVTITFQ